VIHSSRARLFAAGSSLFLGVLACGEDAPTETPGAEAGRVILSLAESVDATPLAFGALVYENAAGNRYSVDRFRYYVSGVRLERTDGSVVEMDAVHYRDAADPGTSTFTLEDVPGGSYVALSLLIGLDAAHNEWGALPDTPENAAMRWPASLGDGYHYAWLEGRYRDETGAAAPYAVRTGRIDDGVNFDDNLVRLVVPTSALVVDEGPVTLDVEVNVNAWFDDPPFDLAENADMVADPAAQAALRDNASDLLDPVIIELEPVSFTFPGAEPPVMPEPAGNPTTRQGIQLGRLLFYDPILSGDSTLACAGCHVQERAFGDPRRLSVGIGGERTPRHAPTIINPGWIRDLFWDGRSPSIEDQAIHPVENPIEMAADWDDVVADIQAHPTYPALFRQVFGTSTIERDLVLKAIAQFERSLISRSSRYDRWLRGQESFTAQEERGWAIFHSESADCFHCHHPNELFTTNQFINIGLDSVVVDPGLGGIDGDPNHLSQFRVPTLRNVGVSAPYMHDGRFATLEEVLEHYRTGGKAGTANVSPLIRTGVGLPLSDQDIEDIIAFLHTLTDESFLTNPDHSNPFE
jgi:cytochrome c peroxidase